MDGLKVKTQTQLEPDLTAPEADYNWMEEEIRRSSGVNFNLLEQSPHPIVVVGLDRTIRRVNKALEKLTGYSASELIGITTPYPWWTDQDPKEKSSRDRDVALERKGQSFEERFRKKSGELFWAEVTPMAIVIDGKPQYYMNMWTDITERKHLEEELRQAAEEWQATFDSITDLVSIQDKDFKLVRVNKAYADTFGMKPEELIGKTCYEVVHGRDKPVPDCPHLKTLETKEASISDFFEPHLGIHLEVVTSPVFTKEGEVIAIVHLAKDVTERKRTEEALHELDRMKAEFISNVSHELRTPLHSISGFTKLMLEGRVSEPETQQEFLTIIDKQSDSLNKIISNLLDMSRLESGRFKIQKQPTLVRDVIRNAVVGLSSGAIEEKGIVIYEDIPALPRMKVDGERLGQVMTNLLSNAIKFSRNGGSVAVKGKVKGGKLLVEVADRGIGITKEAMPHLFERFFRGENSARVGGAGLGLYISKQIIEAHGGRIWIESKRGRGTTVSFTLPLDKAGGGLSD